MVEGTTHGSNNGGRKLRTRARPLSHPLAIEEVLVQSIVEPNQT
uniref:Uncharacterized protein n=1 Tax=Musa acuminata subsp. malaccensis TaxID=214687 RepID=A0A804J7U5_MUSAM